MSCSKAKAEEMDRTAEDSISLNELDRRVAEQRRRIMKAPGYQGPALPPDPGPALADMDLTCLSSAHQEQVRDLLEMFNQMKRQETPETLEAVRVCRMLLGEG